MEVKLKSTWTTTTITLVKGLLDAEIEATGTVEGQFDGKFQLTGISLNVSSLANIHILHRASASPWSLPITPMDEILSGYHVQNLSQRMLRPRNHHLLSAGFGRGARKMATRSLWISTRTSAPLRIGDQADATGFPDVHDGFLTLTQGEIRDNLIPAPITAYAGHLGSTRSQPDISSTWSPSRAEVVTEVEESAQDRVCSGPSDGQLFSAIYRHPDMAGMLPPPMKQIPLGSKVKVTGICFYPGGFTIHPTTMCRSIF